MYQSGLVPEWNRLLFQDETNPCVGEIKLFRGLAHFIEQNIEIDFASEIGTVDQLWNLAHSRVVGDEQLALVWINDPDSRCAGLQVVADLGQGVGGVVVGGEDLDGKIGADENGRDLVGQRLHANIWDAVPPTLSYLYAKLYEYAKTALSRATEK